MSEFVLVHGAWHGPWCWRKVTGLLEAAGHDVRSPELPLEASFERYVEVVSGAVADCKAAIVVGHSMAGAVISQVAENVPGHIERLVFLAAFAPRNGESIAALASKNIASALRDNLSISESGLAMVKDEVVEQAFYHDCEPEDVRDALARLRPQAMAAFAARLSLSEDRYGQVPTQYIECVEDQAIHISLQRQMARDIGCTLINSMSTSHSPFLSAPAELAGLLTLSGPPAS